MIKKLLLIIFLTMSLTSCASVQEKISEINEKLKGDGTPYIPGIQQHQNIKLVDLRKGL